MFNNEELFINLKAINISTSIDNTTKIPLNTVYFSPPPYQMCTFLYRFLFIHCAITKSFFFMLYKPQTSMYSISTLYKRPTHNSAKI